MTDRRCHRCDSPDIHLADVHLSIPVSAFAVAPLGAYVCVACGRVELYVKDRELLPKIAEKYVSLAELKEAGG